MDARMRAWLERPSLPDAKLHTLPRELREGVLKHLGPHDWRQGLGILLGTAVSAGIEGPNLHLHLRLRPLQPGGVLSQQVAGVGETSLQWLNNLTPEQLVDPETIRSLAPMLGLVGGEAFQALLLRAVRAASGLPAFQVGTLCAVMDTSHKLPPALTAKVWKLVENKFLRMVAAIGDPATQLDTIQMMLPAYRKAQDQPDPQLLAVLNDALHRVSEVDLNPQEAFRLMRSVVTLRLSLAEKIKPSLLWAMLEAAGAINDVNTRAAATAETLSVCQANAPHIVVPMVEKLLSRVGAVEGSKSQFAAMKMVIDVTQGLGPEVVVTVCKALAPAVSAMDDAPHLQSKLLMSLVSNPPDSGPLEQGQWLRDVTQAILRLRCPNAQCYILTRLVSNAHKLVPELRGGMLNLVLCSVLVGAARKSDFKFRLLEALVSAARVVPGPVPRAELLKGLARASLSCQSRVCSVTILQGVIKACEGLDVALAADVLTEVVCVADVFNDAKHKLRVLQAVVEACEYGADMTPAFAEAVLQKVLQVISASSDAYFFMEMTKSVAHAAGAQGAEVGSALLRAVAEQVTVNFPGYYGIKTFVLDVVVSTAVKLGLDVDGAWLEMMCQDAEVTVKPSEKMNALSLTAIACKQAVGAGVSQETLGKVLKDVVKIVGPITENNSKKFIVLKDVLLCSQHLKQPLGGAVLEMVGNAAALMPLLFHKTELFAQLEAALSVRIQSYWLGTEGAPPGF
jgi:hypothetical protein